MMIWKHCDPISDQVSQLQSLYVTSTLKYISQYIPTWEIIMSPPPFLPGIARTCVKKRHRDGSPDQRQLMVKQPLLAG